MAYLPIDDSRFGSDLTALPGFLYAYDAFRLSGLADTDPVPTFNEVFGTRDMTSLSSPALATYLAPGINGRPAVSYPRSNNQQHRGGTSNPFASLAGLTIYMVMQHAQVTASGTMVSMWNSALSTSRMFTCRVNTFGTLNFRVYQASGTLRSFTTNLALIASANVPYVLGFRYSGNQLKIQRNSLSQLSSTFTSGNLRASATTAVFSLGAESNTSDNTSLPFLGRLGSVYIYTTSHTDTEMDRAVTELAFRYGIAL